MTQNIDKNAKQGASGSTAVAALGGLVASFKKTTTTADT